jgi:hypothetical protein
MGLVVRPWRLASAAQSASLGMAFGACALVLGWYSILLALALGMSISEPYGWVDGWINEALIKLGRPTFWIGCGFTALVATAVVASVAVFAAMSMTQQRRSFASAAAVVLLWPVMLFIPITVSLGCALTAELPTTWQDGTSVRWHLSTLVHPFGACGVPFVAVMFSVVPLLITHRCIRRDFAETMQRFCHHCHYDRVGLPDGAPCPECGTQSRA